MLPLDKCKKSFRNMRKPFLYDIFIKNPFCVRRTDFLLLNQTKYPHAQKRQCQKHKYAGNDNHNERRSHHYKLIAKRNFYLFFILVRLLFNLINRFMKPFEHSRTFYEGEFFHFCSLSSWKDLVSTLETSKR